MTQIRHYPVQEVTTKHREPSIAFWCTGVPRKLVLFVHGFRGNARTTWRRFPEFLMGSVDGTDLDIVSYQYDGFTTQANSSAVQLRDFLEDFLPSPARLINAAIPEPRPADFQYTRIVFAAHSLGAVVVRLALMQALRRHASGKISAPWLDKVRLVLFAPAHQGAYAAELTEYLMSQAGASLFGLSALAGGIAKHNVPLIEELKIGSPIIEQLQEETRELLGDPSVSRAQLVAAEVIWALREKVVVNRRFCADPDAEQVDTDHFEVCKPALPYSRPVEWLIRALR